MKRRNIVQAKGSTALLPVLFRQYLNAREGWYSKKVGAGVVHFMQHKAHDSGNSVNNAPDNQVQQQWNNNLWNASIFASQLLSGRMINTICI